MKAVRFAWLSETRRTALHSLLLRECSAWSQEWWLRHSAAAIDVYPIDAWHRKGSVRCWRVSDGVAHLLQEESSHALGAFLCDHPAGVGEVLAHRVGERAAADLIDRLARRAKASATELQDDEHEDDQRPELGTYMAVISIGSHKLHISLDRGLADRLVPAGKSAPSPLVQRSQAVEGARLSLEFSLALGSTTLAQLEDLKVGEVLIGDADLSTPFQAHVEHNVVAHGVLGSDGSTRAITLISAL